MKRLTPFPIAGHRLWEEQGALMIIGLSADGAVVCEEFQPASPTESSRLARLRRWLGL